MKHISKRAIDRITLAKWRIEHLKRCNLGASSLVAKNEKQIQKYIKKYSQEEQAELLNCIDYSWDCIRKLESKGWKIK